MNKENKSIAVSIIVFVMVVDLMGFVAWSISKDKPVDNFHAGIITESIINKVR